MKSTHTTQLPTSQLPTAQQPQLSTLDPNNPIALILLLTALLSAIDEPIQALADLLQQLNKLLENLRQTKQK